MEFLTIIYWFVTDKRHFLLHIIEYEVKRYLKFARKYNLHNVEDIEDILYHINAYMSIEFSTRATKYKYLNVKNLVEYKKEVEIQRAVERDFIFEGLKNLPVGFHI